MGFSSPSAAAGASAFGARGARGARDRAESHPLYGVLHDAPNAHLTAYEFREALVVGLLTHGNAYAWISRNGRGQVAALMVQHTDSAHGRYQLSAEPAQTRAWPPGELLADVRYRDPSGRVMHTCTFTVLVLDAITTPEP